MQMRLYGGQRLACPWIFIVSGKGLLHLRYTWLFTSGLSPRISFSGLYLAHHHRVHGVLTTFALLVVIAFCIDWEYRDYQLRDTTDVGTLVLRFSA
ncbi:hypothetical protein BDZ89DRAFT_409215 [Hymenopellis radicata]|nr:hypothetical protein BDZ89DRAFT_409215 [Hymenopellis radicata]